MFLTNILLKKAKSKHIMVLMESAVSGHKFMAIRERLADKLEILRFDPYSDTWAKIIAHGNGMGIVREHPGEAIGWTLGNTGNNIQEQSLYKERKKVRSLKSK